MNKMDQGHVKQELKNGVAEIEFFHPSHNALPGHVLARLTEAITAAGKNPEVVVILLKSGGDRTFCAGASFDELIAIDDMDSGKEFFMGFANVINACRKCPRLIIGRVQGKAVGGGIGLAAATDYCYATKYAAIRLSELAVGIGPFVVGPAVQRKMGTAAFSHLAVNAWDWQNAYWAKDYGLYAEVFDSAKEMDEEIQTLTSRLVDSNPDAMEELKKIFWKDTEHWDRLLEERAETSGALVLSRFTKEAIEKFKKKG